jgi:hypothetical protein
MNLQTCQIDERRRKICAALFDAVANILKIEHAVYREVSVAVLVVGWLDIVLM